MSLVTVIGRGHSGTRMISHTLYASGVYMGEPLNKSGDLLPPGDMYEACRVFARYVTWERDLVWNWDAAFEAEIPQAFTDLVQSYLKTVLASDARHKGWKIPETTLVYPWILRMFPDAKYIFWVRNPRDCILGRHVTDDLLRFGVAYPPVPQHLNGGGDLVPDERWRRAVSWKYQYDLMRAAPRPKHWIEMRFEDFVMNRDREVERLEAFLGLELARIPVNRDAMGRWQLDDGVDYYDFLEPAMVQYGYEIPNQAGA